MKKLTGFVRFVYLFIMFSTIFLILGMQTTEKVFTSKDFPMENAGYLIIDIIIACVCIAIYHRYKDHIRNFLERYGKIVLWISLAVLMVWQLLSCYSAFFYSGWDAGVVISSVNAKLNGDIANINSDYFSSYPNNIFIAWMYYSILKLSDILFGTTHIFILVAFQILLECITMYLVFRVSYVFSENIIFAWTCYIAAILLVGLSPWYIVYYTDATGLMFPILIIRLWQIARDQKSTKRVVVWYMILGFAGMAGYFIKPQLLIVVIAVSLFEVMSVFTKSQDGQRNISIKWYKIISIIIGLVIMTVVKNSVIIPSTGLEIDKEKTYGIGYSILTGLNDENDGVYSEEVVDLAQSFSTSAERKTGLWKEIKRQTGAYSLHGMIRHLCRKEILNYGDGTFAWAVEGHWNTCQPEWSDTFLSVFVRSYILPGGENYLKFISVKQMIWLFILTMSLGTFFDKRRYCTKDLAGVSNQGYDADTRSVLMLSIIGLTLFELIFEARARYLFCYAPIYTIMGIYGFQKLYNLYYRFKPNQSKS